MARPVTHTLLGVTTMLLAVGTVTRAQTVDLVASVSPGATTKGVYTIAADGREACRVVVTGRESAPAQCRVAMPRNTRQLTLQWSGSANGSRGGKPRTYAVIPVDEITSGLRRDRPATWLASLPGAVDAVLRRLGSTETAGGLGLSIGPPVAADALAAAEKRLGFPLDAELKAALTARGRVEFGDSSMTAPAALDTTERQFKAIWGAPEKVAPDALAIYRSSTMVWVEAGDGYGAVIYQPQGPARCGGRPAYWYIHQDTIDEPELVTTADGQCGGLSQAMLKMFVQSLLEQVEDQATEEQFLVDTTTPSFEVWLSRDERGTLSLDTNWTKLR